MLSTFKATFIESKVWVSVKILGLGVDLLMHCSKDISDVTYCFQYYGLLKQRFLFFKRFEYSNNKTYVCKEIS